MTVSYNETKFSKFDVVGEKVLIAKLENSDLKQIGGIFIPRSKKHENMRIGIGKVLQCGLDAKSKYSINEGDLVLYDYYSAFGDWKDNIITNAENVFMKLTEEEACKFCSEGL